MASENAIEMFVAGLVLDPNTQAPVVVLKDEEGKIHIPIWIGIAEATSIASAIKQLAMARPLSHDLMCNMLREFGVSVERIVITELKDSTYYAELILSQGDKVMIFDSRPSDAIALALRTSSRIFVSEQVLEQAKLSFSVMAEQEGEDSGASEGDEVDDASAEGGESAEIAAEGVESQKDFKQINKDRWGELLESLDPDDFKFKM